MAEPNENDPLIRGDNQEERIDLDNRDPKNINEDVAKVKMIDFMFLLTLLASKKSMVFMLSAWQLLLH